MWVVSTHTLFYVFPYYARYVAAAGINNYPTVWKMRNMASLFHTKYNKKQKEE